jgi:hypothetical protein
LSPDETEVAFLSDNGGVANVWAARIADGEMRQITRESDLRVRVAAPLWSPRGDLITFLSTRNTDGSRPTLWLVKPDGSDPRDLGIVASWTCWSGDGKWIYYSVPENDAFRMRKVTYSQTAAAQLSGNPERAPSKGPESRKRIQRRNFQKSGSGNFPIACSYSRRIVDLPRGLAAAREQTGNTGILNDFQTPIRSTTMCRSLPICTAVLTPWPD